MSTTPILPSLSHSPRGLSLDWAQTRAAFRGFLSVEPEQRCYHLGRLFEQLAPWIERGVQTTALRHFLVFPNETALARVFAKVTRRESLQRTYSSFLAWTESRVLSDLIDSSKPLAVSPGGSGEPSAPLRLAINQLPLEQRTPLFLYMVERFSAVEVAQQTGLTLAEAKNLLLRTWASFETEALAAGLPDGWQNPEELKNEHPALHLSSKAGVHK